MTSRTISNPSEDIKVLHLEHYLLNDFEPLHAIKGHLINLCAELPCILSHTVQGDFNQLLTAWLRKEKVTGADLHAIAITLCQFLTGKICTEVQALLESIVRIAQINYLSDQQHTPWAALQMYNCAWYHYEMLQHLIPHPTVNSCQKMFRSYLYDIATCTTSIWDSLFEVVQYGVWRRPVWAGKGSRVAENCTNQK